MDAIRKKEWSWGLVLFLAVLIVYLPAMRCGFIWDDDAHVTKPALRSAHGLVRIWTQPGVMPQYYPLVYSLFWAEHKLWGDSPLGYHVVNILLHALAAVLLWRVLRQLEVPGAWLAAALFALHPVQVESVAWITEVKNTLSGAFYLGAMWCYLRFDRTRDLRAFVAAFGLFVLGLLSKTVIASLPAALLVVFWWKRGKLSWKDDVLPLIPFFLAGMIAGLLTAWFESAFSGASGREYQFTLVERCLIAGRAVWFYLGKLLWPVNLTFIYPRWHVSQAVWWQYFFSVAAGLLVYVLWRIRRQWRAPLAAFLFFAGTLFPALGFFNVYPFRYSFVADHFQYLACIGPLVLAAALLTGRRLLVALLLMILGASTWRQCAMYENAETLWRTTLQRNPSCWMAHLNTGVRLVEQGKFEDAIARYRQAIQIKPDCAEAFYNWGNALVAQGRPDKAIGFFDVALQFDPQLAIAHYNMGLALAALGKTEDAIVQYQRATEIQPDFVAVHVNWGNELSKQGKSQEAIAHYWQALQIDPDSAVAHYNWGSELITHGRAAEAIPHFERVLQLLPDYAEAHFNLGVALAAQGRYFESLPHCEQANRLSGGTNPIMLAGLASIYAQIGRSSDAIQVANQALQLAVAQGNTNVAEAIRSDLARYRNAAGN